MSRQSPKAGKVWRLYLAISLLPISGTQKAVLACLVDHANPTTGRCDPGQGVVAHELGLPLRTVERAVCGLLRTDYLNRRRRARSSNAYEIGWDAIITAFDAYKSRRARDRNNRDMDRDVTRDMESKPTKAADRTDQNGGSYTDQSGGLKGKEKMKREKEAGTGPAAARRGHQYAWRH